MITPKYIDLCPVGTGHRVGPDKPLVRHATADELRSTTVVDPVTGDEISCAALVERDRACHADVDRQYPPRNAYARTPAEHERATAARSACRRRFPVLLRVCRVGGARF